MHQKYNSDTRIELEDWWSQHESMGGYVAMCYVDWTNVHSPKNAIVDLLEKFRKIPEQEIKNFTNASVIDNNMPNRNTLEDASKIFYLTDELEAEGTLLYVPQILHEPWHNRYRVHPGSGRLAALWLCGYETFRTIYTHFDEPGFAAPGTALKLHSPVELIMNCRNTSQLGFFPYIDTETYYAFPHEKTDKCITSSMDSEWDFDQIQTLMPWKFIRYSEGTNFLDYKQQWRQMAWPLWWDLQQPQFVLGDTVFNFDKHGKVFEIIRKGKNVNVVDK